MCLRQYAYGRNIRLQIRYVKFYSTNKIYTGGGEAVIKGICLPHKEKAEFLAWKQNCNMFNKSRGSRVIRVQLKPNNFFLSCQDFEILASPTFRPLLKLPLHFPRSTFKACPHTHFPVHSHSIVIIH